MIAIAKEAPDSDDPSTRLILFANPQSEPQRGTDESDRRRHGELVTAATLRGQEELAMLQRALVECRLTANEHKCRSESLYEPYNR